MSIAEMMRDALVANGATVTFTHTPKEYDGATDTWVDGAPVTLAVPAIEDDGEADQFAAGGLTLRNPVTLIVDAAGLEGATPAPGWGMSWAGQDYTVATAKPRTLDGSPIAWRVTGST